ncbi:MAG: glycine--tRNA ligase subunit beta [Fervidobacterium sp.]
MNEFLFEIGIEELPTTEIDGLVNQLKENISRTLKDEGISFETFEIFVAPRRFGFVLTGLPTTTPDKVIEKKGPAASKAFDESKQPTKALQGFLKSNDSALSDVKIIDNYVYVSRTIKGISMKEVLGKILPQVTTNLKFRKPMRWGDGRYEFVRIPHHILAIFNGEVVPIEIFGIRSSNKTNGHRFIKDEYFEVSSSQDYFERLDKFYVIPQIEKRIEFIHQQLSNFEKEGFTIDKDEELIREVAILTEYPKLVSGKFLEKFLQLPEELIRTTIKHHQRSFTGHKDGKITNIFVSFIDKPADIKDNGRKGYEKVINARLEDARYYYEKDVQVKLESFNEKLVDIVFQKELGTLYDKVERIIELSRNIIEILDLDKISDKILRTARLCKADISCHVVYEFPELQGIMGRIYALKDGEDEDVAWGIQEHYMSVPETVEGAVVGIADRIDTIAGNFVIGNIPSGSKDPYGLRSKVDDIYSIVEKFAWDLDLGLLIDKACELLKNEPSEELLHFFETRYELYNSKVRYDIARATKHLWTKPLRGILSAYAIDRLVGSEEFEHLLVGFERVHNISKRHDSANFDSAKFTEPEEKELFEKFIEVKPKVLDALEHLDYQTALEQLIKLRRFIDRYFDKVFVMTEEDDIRLNRLGFLKSIDQLFMDIGDLTQIERI